MNTNMLRTLVLSVALAGISGLAGETTIVGNKGSAWPSSWTEIPALRDGNDTDANVGNDRLDFIFDSTGKGTVYWAKDDSHIYFRTRMNISTFTTYADMLWIFIKKVGKSANPCDYAFSWDSKSNDNTKHGLEMQVYYRGGTDNWTSLEFSDIDGVNGSKGANDINVGGRNTDGYMRALDSLSGADTGTCFIDWAVSWT